MIQLQNFSALSRQILGLVGIFGRKMLLLRPKLLQSSRTPYCKLSIKLKSKRRSRFHIKLSSFQAFEADIREYKSFSAANALIYQIFELLKSEMENQWSPPRPRSDEKLKYYCILLFSCAMYNEKTAADTLENARVSSFGHQLALTHHQLTKKKSALGKTTLKSLKAIK